MEKESIFKDKSALQSSFYPNVIIHREDELKHIAKILAPALKMERPSNLFIYGKTGTGKTLSVKHITAQIKEIAGKKEIPIKIFYINCKLKKIADTEYRIIAHLAKELGKAVPATGLPTDEVYKIFYSTIEEQEQLLIIILDEIDQLITKAGDGVLYNLTRINGELEKAQISLIGISNDLMFSENIDPRVKSSLSEEEMIFATYNAMQLQDILKERTSKAFKEGVLKEGVIAKCAAYAAREHGDARRALELLRVAAELAERESNMTIDLSDVDSAENRICKDRVYDVVRNQPKQFQAVLYSILYLAARSTGNLLTGDIYRFYTDFCNQCMLKVLTQRRFSDILNEMSMLGLITSSIISKGRYGRMRDISITIPDSTRTNVMTFLKEELAQ